MLAKKKLLLSFCWLKYFLTISRLCFLGVFWILTNHPYWPCRQHLTLWHSTWSPLFPERSCCSIPASLPTSQETWLAFLAAAFLPEVALVVKKPPVSAGDTGDPGSIPESGRSLGEGKGNSLKCFYLGNSMHRGAWRAPVHGSQWVRQDGARARARAHTHINDGIIQQRQTQKEAPWLQDVSLPSVSVQGFKRFLLGHLWAHLPRQTRRLWHFARPLWGGLHFREGSLFWADTQLSLGHSMFQAAAGNSQFWRLSVDTWPPSRSEARRTWGHSLLHSSIPSFTRCSLMVRGIELE